MAYNKQEEDAAYAAGIVDGEGSIVVHCFNRAGRGLQFSARIIVVNTHRPLLEWLVGKFGGNIVPKPKSRPTSKQCWEWQVYSETADRFADAIAPHLKIKTEQLSIFRKMRERQKERASHRPRKRLFDWEVNERMEWISRMRILNRQGAR